MPKIRIQEIDETTGSLTSVDNVVFVPIKKYEGMKATEKEFILINAFKTESFKELIGNYPTATGSGETPTEEQKCWLYAYHLVSLGLSVLTAAIESLDVLFGTDLNLIKKVEDKTLWDVRFITTGAFERGTKGSGGEIVDDGYTSSLCKSAENRGDAIALCDHNSSLKDATKIQGLFATYNSSFGAAFSPWCEFNFDGTHAILPGSFAFLSAYAKSIQSYPSWYAVAGSVRGIIPNLVKPVVDFGDADCDTLQCRAAVLGDAGDNVGVAVNPIAYIRGFGYLIWGNRTLLKNGKSGTTALSFLNVRNLVVELKKTLYIAGRTLTFEQNSDILWLNYKALVTPTLETMLSGNGIGGYKCFKLATKAKATLKAKFQISPIEAVEDFDLYVNLVDNETSVSESV
jgi:hypothetical protein